MEITMSFALAACEAIARETANPAHRRSFSLLINTHPTIVYCCVRRQYGKTRNDCWCFFLEIRTSIKRCQRLFPIPHPVGAAEGCDLLILIFKNKIKRSQHAAAPTQECAIPQDH